MKHLNILTTAAVAATILFGATASFANEIVPHNAWARASAGKAGAGAAFMELHSHATGDDKLIAAKADISSRVELHTHLMDGDIMRMRKVDHISVKPNEVTMLQPGGDHVMFMGLKSPLKEGDSFPLTLVFEKSGEVNVTVKVMSAGAKGAMKMEHGDHQDEQHGMQDGNGHQHSDEMHNKMNMGN